MEQKNLVNLTMFDLLKGVLMILVVLRHSMVSSVDDSIFWRILYSFMMPVFFITSGYWMKKRKFRAGVESSARGLLKPFGVVLVTVNGIGALHRLLSHNLEEWVNVFLIPTLLVRSGEESRIGTMWFVFALFLSWCLFYGAVNLWKEQGQMIFACVCGVAAGLLMPWCLPFQISQGLAGFFFVYGGYQMKKKKLLEKRLSWGTGILIAGVWVLSIIYGSMDLAVYKMDHGLLSLPGSLCGAYLTIRLFLHLNCFEHVILDKIRWMGRYSMWILCIHSVEGTVFPWKVLFAFIPQNSWAGVWAQFVLRWCFIGGVCWLLILGQRRLHQYKMREECQ